MAGEIDEALLARLNALKPSSVSLDTISRDPKTATGSDGELAARLEQFGISAGPEGLDKRPCQDAVEEQSIEELLAELGPEDQWNVDHQELGSAGKLMREAREAIASTNDQPEIEHGGENRAVEEERSQSLGARQRS